MFLPLARFIDRALLVSCSLLFSSAIALDTYMNSLCAERSVFYLHFRRIEVAIWVVRRGYFFFFAIAAFFYNRTFLGENVCICTRQTCTMNRMIVVDSITKLPLSLLEWGEDQMRTAGRIFSDFFLILTLVYEIYTIQNEAKQRQTEQIPIHNEMPKRDRELRVRSLGERENGRFNSVSHLAYSFSIKTFYDKSTCVMTHPNTHTHTNILAWSSRFTYAKDRNE